MAELTATAKQDLERLLRKDPRAEGCQEGELFLWKVPMIYLSEDVKDAKIRAKELTSILGVPDNSEGQ